MRLRSVLAVLAAVAVVAAGCSTSLPASVKQAPVLHIATGLYPFAQAASMIGGAKVVVDDLVPDGTDPYAFVPTDAEASTLHRAGLVLLAAPGLQPGLEAGAAAGSGRVVWLSRQAGATDPYVWLDPAVMGRAVAALGQAMEKADPQAAALFRQNTGGLEAEVNSLRLDFSSTFSACPNTTFFTADTAFSAMAADFGLTNHALGPDPVSGASAVQKAGVDTVFREPWVDNSGVAATAAAAHVKVKTLDTLAGAPAGGWPARSTYFSLMEQDLGVLSPTMGCPNDETQ